MRFNDEYRKEMNKKHLSDDFIKSLAAKMAETAEQNKTDNETTEQKETIETKAIEYRENKTMSVIKISAAVAAAAAVVIVMGSLLNKAPEEENISVSPAVTSTAKISEAVSEAVSETFASEQSLSTENTAASETVPAVTEIITETAAPPVQETAVTETPSVQASVNPEVSENIPETAGHNDSYYTENAAEIFDAINLIDCLGIGWGIDVDKSDSFSEKYTNPETGYEYDFEYVPVTDSRFTSFSDVSDFMHKYLTDSMTDSGRYASVLSYRFKEKDGKLYVTQTATSCGFSWSSDEITVADKTENTCTLIRTYNDFGAVSELRLHMVKSDSAPGWKISSAETAVQ